MRRTHNSKRAPNVILTKEAFPIKHLSDDPWTQGYAACPSFGGSLVPYRCVCRVHACVCVWVCGWDDTTLYFLIGLELQFQECTAQLPLGTELPRTAQPVGAHFFSLTISGLGEEESSSA